MRQLNLASVCKSLKLFLNKGIHNQLQKSIPSSKAKQISKSYPPKLGYKYCVFRLKTIQKMQYQKSSLIQA